MSNRNDDIAVMSADREKTIVRTSVVGIITNLFLVGFKAFVGFLSNSIAVILDAVNNLSDALSSVVTIIGAKLGAKQPDKTIRFDVVVSFDADRKEAMETLRGEVAAAYPGYEVIIVPDADVAD